MRHFWCGQGIKLIEFLQPARNSALAGVVGSRIRFPLHVSQAISFLLSQFLPSL